MSELLVAITLRRRGFIQWGECVCFVRRKTLCSCWIPNSQFLVVCLYYYDMKNWNSVRLGIWNSLCLFTCTSFTLTTVAFCVDPRLSASFCTDHSQLPFILRSSLNRFEELVTFSRTNSSLAVTCGHLPKAGRCEVTPTIPVETRRKRLSTLSDNISATTDSPRPVNFLSYTPPSRWRRPTTLSREQRSQHPIHVDP